MLRSFLIRASKRAKRKSKREDFQISEEKFALSFFNNVALFTFHSNLEKDDARCDTKISIPSNVSLVRELIPISETEMNKKNEIKLFSVMYIYCRT